MQSNPLDKAIFGVYLIIVGLVMTILHKQVQGFHEDLFAGLPWILRRFWPRGVLLTVMIIVFGVMSILIGIALLSVAFVQQ
jgi:vacuolar-type H+-ATPase subunit I/STV1